jgi:putative transposase
MSTRGGSSAGSSPAACAPPSPGRAQNGALPAGPGADVQLVHHSDRGSQYSSGDYTQTLDDHGVLASVGSTGDAYDNALAESFVDSFKTELIADRVWQTRPQLQLAIVESVGSFNTTRPHSALTHLSPQRFEH